MNQLETETLDQIDSIDLPNERRTGSKLNKEFQLLIKRINQILYQTKFDLDNGEYIYKEHCNELRRQVQLAKETQILKIEEKADKLMKEIDEFEKESLETVLKVNKEKLFNKFIEMKQENEKWNERLDEFKVDNEILNQLRDSLSKIAVERDNFNCLLHNKMMKFKEYKDQLFIGELSQVSLDSLDQIFFKKQIEEIEKGFSLNDAESNQIVAMSFDFREGKILSNGDLLFCGEMRDDDDDFHDLVLAVFDLNKDFKLKKVKQLCVDYKTMATSSDRICLTYKIKHRLESYRAREETEDDKEYDESNDEFGDYVVLILNENLEKLHRFKRHYMIFNFIGANDSFLFFAYDSEHKGGAVSFYTWSLEYVKTISQSNDPNLPFYFKFNPYYRFKFVDLFGKYYFLDANYELRIIDEKNGILLKKIKADDFCFDNNYNIILSHNHSIKYLSFNGDFLKEIQMGNNKKNYFLLNNDKRSFVYDENENRLCFWHKYDEDTHEVY